MNRAREFSTSRREMRSDQGVALIIVISALVMLLVLAIPFVMTGKKDFRIASTAASKMRARALVDSAFEWSLYELGKTHPGAEAAGIGKKTPYWDTSDEFALDPHPAAWESIFNARDGRRTGYRADPRGDLWSVRATDEQSKINLDTAPPYLLGAIFGRTVLTEDTQPSAAYIAVESIVGFPPTGGEVLIGSELVTYKEAKDNRLVGAALQGEYKKDTVVLSKLALDVAMFDWKSKRPGVKYGGFGMTTAIKEVARVGKRPIAESEIDQVLAPFTVYGKRPSTTGWMGAQRVLGDLTPAAFDTRRGQPVRVRNADYFNTGTVVAISDGQNVEYNIVVRSIRRDQEGILYLLEPVGRIYLLDTATISAEMRHPVNINNCTRETLVMLMEGLEMTFQNPRPDAAKRVSKDLAGVVADMIIKNRPIQGHEHFAELMKTLFLAQNGKAPTYEGAMGAETLPAGDMTKLGMTQEMAWAIVQNALNPCHRALLQSTMPFGFTSGDIFTIEAEASVNDASGTELARHRGREVVRAAPSRTLTFKLDTQEEFEDSIITGRRSRFIETNPIPQAFYTGFNAKPEPRMFRHLSYFEDPGRKGWFADKKTGDVRLQPARLSTAAQGDFEEHFDGDAGQIGARGSRSRNNLPTELVSPEGYRLVGRPYDLPLASGRLGGGQRGQSSQNSGTIVDDHGLLPFAIEFFTKPQSFASGPVFFSLAGDDAANDFVRCWFEPTDQSIHLKVHDITIDAPGGIEEAAESVWTPTKKGIFEDDTWFHIAAHVGGTRPEQSSIHVDGWKRGEAKFQSRLQSSLSATSTTFTVEDATGWPDYGPFWIGPEVVEAERTSGNTYTIFNWGSSATVGTTPVGRGTRGSVRWAKGHSSGETVSVFGYSSTLVTPVLASGVATAQQSSVVLPEGGGKPASTLYPFAVASVMGNSQETIHIGPVTISVKVYDPAVNPDIDLGVFNGQNIQDVQNAFQSSGGYALICTYSPLRLQAASGGGAGAAQGPIVVELVKYRSRQNNTLMGVTGVTQVVNPDLMNGAALTLGAAGAGGGQATSVKLDTQRVKHDTQRLGGGPNAQQLTAIFPISVHLTSITGYREPDPNLANAGSSSGSNEPEFIQLGQPQLQPTYRNAAQHRVEWIRYYHIDRSSSMLLCDEKDVVERAVAACIAPIAAGNDPNELLIASQLQFRAQLGTSRFGWTTLGRSNDSHPTSEDAIPVFRTDGVPVYQQTAATNSTSNTPTIAFHTPAGFGDSVTLISDVDKVKERHYVAWSAANNFSGYPTALVAFCDNVKRRISQRGLPTGQADRRIYTRIVKFPSGELPLITQTGQGYIGGDTNGQVRGAGFIDEVRMRGLAPERYILWDDQVLNPSGTTKIADPLPIAVNAQDTDIPISAASWPVRLGLSGAKTNWTPDARQLDIGSAPTALPPDGGLVIIDDEVIAFSGVSSNGSGYMLTDCKRGFMNTVPTSHSYGGYIVLLDWRAVSRIAGSVDTTTWEIPIESDADFQPFGGTVLIDQEMVHYTRTGGNMLTMPRVPGTDGTPSDRGIFRGRYGTKRSAHASGDIVLDMPYRYWDRYVPESDDPDLAMYEFSINEPGSYFGDIKWSHKFAKANIGMKLLARLDPKVSWATPPAASGGRLKIFDSKSGQADHVTNTAPIRVNGEGLEVRVFFTYEDNAFDPIDLTMNGWKETPILEDVEIGYITTPTVLKRETLQ